MNVSVIVTVKNEGEAIRPLLDSLIEQTRQPDEIIICDGGSVDSTIEVLTEYQAWLPLTVIVAPGANISEGRNQAIAAAQGPIVAGTDAGVVLSPTWLEDIIAPIEAGKAPVVSGWFEPDPFTDFEVVMGNTVLPGRQDVNPELFLPSSRSVAFLKSAWEAVGGYPEWLDYSEDLIFDLALREKYGAFPFADTAVAYFRPRGSLRSFFRQYYFYARGDGKANLWRKRHVIRYVTYLLGFPFLLRLIWQGRKPGVPLLVLGVGAYCRRPAERLWDDTWGWRPPARLRAFALIPIIRLVGDVAKMAGYPVGVWWRMRHRNTL
ncbi:MAG: glycosyltransferase [Anaerolineales bacterium]|nr:glycosyltransferase [Anaerolineales bacterium]MCB8966932.1 glycosyltransferase [Ardenticatenaceae bacterium]MCB8989096.1 glycosyltransferase [Ardenticatenaceae bacterium]